jgi:adenine/guanine phosphoribosyltransferase-like PRPP-binding protein
MDIHLKTGTLVIECDKNFSDLSGFASRNNSKRGYLFLSKVLGKHYPSDPYRMQSVHELIADEIKPHLKDGPTVIFGFSETATCLGYGVYLALGLVDSYYHHSTRHQIDHQLLLTFSENHSHASSHYVYFPKDKRHIDILKNAKNIVLVDDEYSTGNTLHNVISSFNKAAITPHFVAASILDWTNNKRNHLLPNIVSLVKGNFCFSANTFEPLNNHTSQARYEIIHSELSNIYGRVGCEKIEIDFMSKLTNIPKPNDRILVLGTGEFMNVAYELALFIKSITNEVLLQSTTRSPILLGNDVKSILAFKDNYGEQIDNFLYNVSDQYFDHIYICYETKKLPDKHDLIKQLSKIAPSVTALYF